MNEQEKYEKGLRIKQLRENLGLNQMELAEKVGVSPTSVSNWETGKQDPKYESVEKLAAVFNESIRYIQTGERYDDLDPASQKAVDEALLLALKQSVDDVQSITIKVEDQGFLSLEIGVYAFGIAVIALAFSLLATFSRTALSSIVFIVLILFGLWFIIFGKAVLKKKEKRVREERAANKE